MVEDFTFRLIDHGNVYLAHKFLIEIPEFESKLTAYEIKHGFPPTITAKTHVAGVLKKEISLRTGIDFDSISVRKFFFGTNQFMVSLDNEEERVMFKMVYYGKREDV